MYSQVLSFVYVLNSASLLQSQTWAQKCVLFEVKHINSFLKTNFRNKYFLNVTKGPLGAFEYE